MRLVEEFGRGPEPFLLSLHFTAPHWPWEAPGPAGEAESRRLAAKHDPEALGDFDGGDSATYAAMVTRMDFQIGRVLDALERAGAAADTIVIFTSDNGGERFSDTWPFTGKKTDLLEGGLRIPAILRWPGRVAPGATSDQVMISMDWLPTLLAAAGSAPDPAYPPDGISLLAHLAPGAPATPRTLYWRYLNKNQSAVRDGDWKYLGIMGNSFLFDVVADSLERANLKGAPPGGVRPAEGTMGRLERHDAALHGRELFLQPVRRGTGRPLRCAGDDRGEGGALKAARTTMAAGHWLTDSVIRYGSRRLTCCSPAAP